MFGISYCSGGNKEYLEDMIMNCNLSYVGWTLANKDGKLRHYREQLQ